MMRTRENSKQNEQNTVSAGTYLAGQQLSEFAIILGLVVVLSGIILFQFKDSVPELINGTSGNLKDSSDSHMVSQTLGGTNTGASGNGTTSFPSATGGEGPQPQKFQLEIQLEPVDQRVEIRPYSSTGTDGIGNTTSELGEDTRVDINRSKVYPALDNVYGTLKVAKVLQAMADEEPDNTVKAYYQHLARLSYYIGGTEGELDDLNGLDINPSITGNGKNYSNGDAARDIINYSKQLRDLVDHPPASLNHQSLFMAQALGHEVWRVSQTYINGFKGLLDENDHITENWSNDPDCEAKKTCEQGGRPGLSLTSKKDTGYDKTLPIQGWQYDQLYPYELLAAQVNSIFSQSDFLTEPIRVTLIELAKEGDNKTASK